MTEQEQPIDLKLEERFFSKDRFYRIRWEDGKEEVLSQYDISCMALNLTVTRSFSVVRKEKR